MVGPGPWPLLANREAPAAQAQQQADTETPCSDPPCSHDGSGEPCDEE